MFTSRRMTIFLALMGLFALAAVACSSDDPPAGLPSPTSAPSSTATQVPAATTPTTAAAPTAEATTASASSASADPDRADLTSDNFNWLVEEVGKGTKPAIAIAPDGTPNIAFMFESQDGFVKAGARIDGA